MYATIVRKPHVVRRCAALVLGMLVCGTGVALAQQPDPTERPAEAPALPPVVPAPGPGMLVVSCDPGGCWDEFGMRYDRADAGVFIRRDGSSCIMHKGRMHCE